MNVFKYMGIKPKIRCRGPIYPTKDGNLMVLAIQAMQSKGDWEKFLKFCNVQSFEHEINIYKSEVFFDADDIADIFGDTAKFFELMEEALKEGVIGI